MLFATFAAKADVRAASFGLALPVAQRRQSEALVLLRILGVADAEQRQFHKVDNGRQHSFPWQPVALQVLIDAGADQWQDPAEHQHFAELGLIAHLAPTGMIAILLAAALVA